MNHRVAAPFAYVFVSVRASCVRSFVHQCVRISHKTHIDLLCGLYASLSPILCV